jgi:hypothetical protein
MAIRIQFRRSTAAEWTAANPILAQGELALELDTTRFKIGDGINPWSALPYTSNPLPSIANILDVDLSGLNDGGILVYNNSINKWEATNELTKQQMDGGFW